MNRRNWTAQCGVFFYKTNMVQRSLIVLSLRLSVLVFHDRETTSLILMLDIAWLRHITVTWNFCLDHFCIKGEKGYVERNHFPPNPTISENTRRTQMSYFKAFKYCSNFCESGFGLGFYLLKRFFKCEIMLLFKEIVSLSRLLTNN